MTAENIALMTYDMMIVAKRSAQNNGRRPNLTTTHIFTHTGTEHREERRSDRTQITHSPVPHTANNAPRADTPASRSAASPPSASPAQDRPPRGGSV